MTTRLPIFAVCLVSAMTSALPLNDTTHQFSIDIPTGYVRRESKNALHSFKREDSDQASWAVLLIGTLGGTLDQNTEFDRGARETATKASLARRDTTVSSFEYRSVSWKGFALEVMVMRAQTRDADGVTSLSAAIPLASGAIELQRAGPTAAETKLIAEFDGLVDSVKGATNWGMTLNQLEQLSQRVGYGVTCLGCGLVVAWLWFRKRSSKS